MKNGAILLSLLGLVFGLAGCDLLGLGDTDDPGGGSGPTLPDGELASAFGTGGIVTTRTTANQWYGRALDVDSSDRIFVAGVEYDGTNYQGMLVVRYTNGGVLDTTFGSAGVAKVYLGTPGGGDAKDVLVQSNGSVVLGGASYNTPVLANSYDFATARLTSAGGLDTTWNAVGYREDDLGLQDEGTTILEQSDGKIVLLGSINGTSTNSTGYINFGLARYSTTGGLDPTFGSGGWVYTDVSAGGDESITSGFLQADGAIVAVGNADNGTDSDIAVARYLSNGTLDTAFGVNGTRTFAIGTGYDYAYAAVLLDSGSILITGMYEVGTGYGIFLARLKADGALDTAFGTSGIRTYDLGFTDARAYGLLVDNDRIVVAGSAGASGSRDSLIARFSMDGTIDSAFGSFGAMTITGSTGDDLLFDVAAMSDGDYVAAGYAAESSSYAFSTVRIE